MFQLTNQDATISSVTPRAEKHGDESVPAISLSVKITAANTLLDTLSQTLRTTLYKSAEEATGQAILEAVETATPVLRTVGIESLSFKGAAEGWSMHIEWGIDDEGAIDCGSCKVDKFKVHPMQGGSIELTFRIGTSDVDADSIGKLGMLIGQEVQLSLTPPVQKEPAIDGTGNDGTWPFPKHESAAEQGSLIDGDAEHMDATDSFVQSHGDPEDGADGEGSDTDIDPDGPLDLEDRLEVAIEKPRRHGRKRDSVPARVE